VTGSFASWTPEVAATTVSSRKAEFASVFASEEAFRAWYDVAAPRVYTYLHGRCGGEASLAEELTQQTFVSAIRGRARFDGRADPLTWIIAIARSRLVDHYRRLAREERRHLRVVVAEIARPSTTGEAMWHDGDAREGVMAALHALPAEQRAALVLHHVDGLPIREVASELGRSASAVESLLARARRRFRQVYEEAGHD
jgi:RNA polymerase sigma-70 factor, ECF subfamily